jgi:mono/diheme cytochrome c family protein
MWLGLLVTPVRAQEPPAPEWKIPPEEAKRENPVKSGEASIASGKRTYRIDCEMCHGPQGDGKTELAESMQLNLRDLRDPATLKDYTDGGLAYLIQKGKNKMPGGEGRLKGNQVWNLVNFLRTLPKKEEPAAEKPKEEKPPQ